VNFTVIDHKDGRYTVGIGDIALTISSDKGLLSFTYVRRQEKGLKPIPLDGGIDAELATWSTIRDRATLGMMERRSLAIRAHACLREQADNILQPMIDAALLGDKE
jgi:hypothetical protein